MTRTSTLTGHYRPCGTCRAPTVVPFPPAWSLDLIKEGPVTGPIATFMTPHRDDCDAPTPVPSPGFAIRVSGRFVANLTITPPPVPTDPFGMATSGFVFEPSDPETPVDAYAAHVDHIHWAPSPSQTWTPDIPPLTREQFEAARDAILRRSEHPYVPEPLHLSARAHRWMRDYFDRLQTERANRENLEHGYLYKAPIVTDPPTATSPAGWPGWTSLGYTTEGLGFDEHGQYIPTAEPPSAPVEIRTQVVDGMPADRLWIGSDPEAPEKGIIVMGIGDTSPPALPDVVAEPGELWADDPVRPDRNAIYGGPPSDPEPGPAPE